MPQSKELPDGRLIKSQVWITSTRKGPAGFMQERMDEYDEAMRQGNQPPFDIYNWCIFEAAQNVPECGTTCGCENVKSGTWSDGSDRTFRDVCRGRLKRARGFIALHDIWGTFTRLSTYTWDAQKENKKPEMGGQVWKTWDRDRYCIRFYDPDPAFGAIYQGVDWGVGNPAAVLWFQVLNRDRWVHGRHQRLNEEPKRLLKEGTAVIFHEIYVAELDAIDLGRLVLEQEEFWKRKHAGFRVLRRYADKRGLQERVLWREKLNLPTQWERDGKLAVSDRIEDQIIVCNKWLERDMFAVDQDEAPMFVAEAEAYRYPKPRAGMVDSPTVPIDDFNHTQSAFRYALVNIDAIVRGKSGGAEAMPKAGSSRHTTAGSATRSTTAAGAPRYLPRTPGSRP